MQTDVSTRSNESTACGPRVWLAIEQAHDGGVVEERAGWSHTACLERDRGAGWLPVPRRVGPVVLLKTDGQGNI